MNTSPTQNTPNEIDEILTNLENVVARDVQLRLTQHRSGRSPKSSHAEAIAKLQALITAARIEAQLEILRGFRRRDFVRGDFYQVAVIDRITTLTNDKIGGEHGG